MLKAAHLALLACVVEAFLPLVRPATIRGVILESNSNEPISHARITVSRNGSRVLAETEADQNGRFQCDDLEPDYYQIRISAQNHITLIGLISEGDNRNIEEQAGHLYVFRLIRCGVISGQVLDAQGQPATSASVVAFRKISAGDGHEPKWQQITAVNNVASTGAFRFYGLSPGTYRLGAYHCSSEGLVLFPSEFTFISGESYEQIKMTSPFDEGFSISGHLQIPTDYVGVVVLVDVRQPQVILALRSITGVNDAFHFTNVGSGTYDLLSIATSKSAERQFGFATVTLSGASVDGVQISMSVGRHLPARVHEQSARNAISCAGPLQIDAKPGEATQALAAGRVRWTGAKEALTSLGPFGPWLYDLTVTSPGGLCQSRFPIEFDLRSGTATNVLVSMAPLGAIHGHVNDHKDDWIILVPVNGIPERQPIQLRQVDEGGNFEFDNLPKGKYYVLARSARSAEELWVPVVKHDPDPIEITPGDRREVDLRATVR